ncbi:MAG TPA: ABC transporter ATP-binding protein [Microthrixaceae bacterium]|nr:ABC transporter ATP-binding protein [Microthrixaceae bacterium]
MRTRKSPKPSRVNADPADTTPPGPNVAVELRDVDHTFGDNQALRDLSFSVPNNKITVLLGPNGAGKTTAFRAITGALSPDSGSVRTLGLDPDSEGHIVRPRCGVVSAKPALYDRLSGRDNLLFAAELYGMSRNVDDRVAEVAGRFGIFDALGDAVGGYSTGMKTRLALARAVLHDPELLLFDEPTSGLDPESAHAVLDLIKEMTRDGHSIVMCTHLLAEAEGLADHVIMMEGGTAMIAGSPNELTQRFWPRPIVHLDAEDPRLLDRISNWPGVEAYRRSPAGARIELSDPDKVPDLIDSLVRDGVRLTRVEPHRPTLEDLYFMIRRGGADESGADSVLAPIRQRWSESPPPVPPMISEEEVAAR